MLTGRGSRAIDMEAMELGATDYLVKGLIDPDALERAIRHGMEREAGAKAVEENDRLRQAFIGGSSLGEQVSEPGVAAARFKALFEATRSAVALVGLDGKLTAGNPAFAQLFSGQDLAMQEISYLDLVGEADKEPAALELDELVKGVREQFESARRFCTGEGRLTWANSTATLVRSSDGTPDHLLLVLDRIPER